MTFAAHERVEASPLITKTILIDDWSTDGTRELLVKPANTENLKIFEQWKDQGKGATLNVGIPAVTGNTEIVQEADLEYDPSNDPNPLGPILYGRADAVSSSRAIGECRRVLHFRRSHMFTYMEIGYKLFSREIIQRFADSLIDPGFGIEAELMARTSSTSMIRIYQMPINYLGRTYEGGKNITWRNGMPAQRTTVRYGLLRKRPYQESKAERATPSPYAEAG